MKLPFMDRSNECRRLTRALGGAEGSFCCLYGRRRSGKSRLLREALPLPHSVYYVGDEREASLQRAAAASAISRLIPGFADVTYTEWEALLTRWWRDAPDGAVLALDEFPYLVAVSLELPSLLQKLLDLHASRPVHLIVCGSSQRMMQGLVLDASAPLYGRAREVIKVEPLGAHWAANTFGGAGFEEVARAYSIWGGVPRYWELARDHSSTWEAVEALVLDPMGVLHHEPRRLLLDDMRDTIQASSILALVGQGCSRLSEIAGRIGKPATSLTRPVHRLLELGLLRREVPFGANVRASKKTLYHIDDPFLAFWFRFVEPNRSRLGAGAVREVLEEARKAYPAHAGLMWEQLVRSALPRLTFNGRTWGAACRWWGSGVDRTAMELDVVAESTDRRTLLVGEAKLALTASELSRIEAQLQRKADNLPFRNAYREVELVVFARNVGDLRPAKAALVSGPDLFEVLT